jgi:hypothetical protein
MLQQLKTLLFALIVVSAAACSAASVPAGATQGPVAAGDEDSFRASGDDASGDQSGETGATGGQPNEAPAPPDQQLIVYTGTLDIDVPDVDAALGAAQHLVTGLGGYVASSRVSNSGSDVSAYVIYRIPAARWDEALSGLRGLAEKVTDEQIGSEDVTSQVVDLDARIANARTTEAALQAIMDRAQTITDVLKVQQELSKIRGDIESMTAERDYLAGRAAFGTLEVAYNVPVTASAVAAEGWDLGREIDAALASLVRIGQWLASVIVWVVIVLLPVVLPLLVLAWIAYRLRRRWLISHPRPAAPDGAGWR